MSSSVNRRAREAITARLAAAAPNGFNAVLATKCADIGIASEAFTIDFAGTTYRNFFLGLVDVQTVTAEVLTKIPMMAVGAVRAENFNRIKRSVFSGQLSYGIQIWVGWDGDRSDFERLTEAVQETLLDLFNAAQDSLLGAGLIYNYEIAFDLTPILSGLSKQYVRALQATLVMDVDVGG